MQNVLMLGKKSISRLVALPLPAVQLFPSKGQVGSQFKCQCIKNNACRVFQANCLHGHAAWLSDHRCERVALKSLRSCMGVPSGQEKRAM